MPDIPRSRLDLEQRYREQWHLLRKSCDSYDAGDRAEAARIAVSLRMLLHNTRRSKSLLSQLQLDETLFFDTASPIRQANLLPSFTLVCAKLGTDSPEFVPSCEVGEPQSTWLIPFEYWWEGIAILIPDRFQLTRSDIVLTMADQDGGAHVDPAVEERYYRLTRENALGFVAATPIGEVPLANVERASVRQIAQEVLVSLVTPRRIIPPDMPDGPEPSPLVRIAADAATGAVRRSEIRRIMLCPCQSGLPYRECHAYGGANEGKRTAPRRT